MYMVYTCTWYIDTMCKYAPYFSGIHTHTHARTHARTHAHTHTSYKFIDVRLQYII